MGTRLEMQFSGDLELAMATGHAMKGLITCIIQTFRDVLSLTYLDADLLA